MVQGYGSSHARLTFAVGKVLVITDSVFSILDNDTDFRPLLHQVTGKAQSHIIRILIFMQFYFADSADSSGVGASMSAHYIKQAPCKRLDVTFTLASAFPNKGSLIVFFPLPTGFDNGGSTYFTPSRNSSFPLRSFLFSSKTPYNRLSPGACYVPGKQRFLLHVSDYPALPEPKH